MSIHTFSLLDDLPAPTTVNAVQKFTDVVGDTWVAKSSVGGGQWRLARDALNAVVWRRAGPYNMPTAQALFQFDSVVRDVYGMWTPARYGLTLPIAGWWRIYTTIDTTSVNIHNYVQGSIFINATAITSDNQCTVIGAGSGISWRSQRTWKVNAGDVATVQAYQSQSGAVELTGSYNNRLEASYLGTG